MFESLSDRLQAVFQKLGSKGRLTEDDVREAMKQVRLALLEADVNFRVVKEFVAKVTEQAIGEEVTKSLTPHQQVIKIVHQELINLLGTENVPLQEVRPGPTVIMLVGLQGTGKTTLAAKLALHLRKKGKRVLLVAADVYRPAAITQLQALGRQLNIPVYSEGTQASPPDIAEHALEHARKELFNVVIIDTAGRLQIDEPLMQELEQIENRVHPIERLLVVDAMTGQEAVRVAETFNQRVKLTGVVMTKMDGDARGGAALSVRAVTGVPIKFLSTGEKVDGNTLEVFHPDRLASRILGMGDVLSLIERAEQLYDAEQAKKMQKRLSKGEFDFEDFLNSLHQMRKLGPLQQIIAMIPGLNQLARNEELLDERHVKRVEAIIYSMTPEERRRPEIIKGSRRERIARGSGTSVQEVSQLVKQFQQMQRMMKQLAGKGGKGRGDIDPNELLRRLR
ncbi:signal recognition particle protein [Chloroflexus sp.]|uniref:signal recognition particle protein n=1 Tax=Chloroflexus sp. TaxID=1904827 RepID=UPI002ADE2884|nr:signal recognition particle protein [Chloroflexus sp.]